MLAIQFRIFRNCRFEESFYIYRSIANTSKIIFNESGMLSEILYCRRPPGVELFPRDNDMWRRTSLNIRLKIHVKLCPICMQEPPPMNVTRNCCDLDDYCVSAFCYLLKTSAAYRRIVLDYHYGVFSKERVAVGLIEINLLVDTPERHLLDYTGSKLSLCLLYKKITLESEISWLSTLGEAFSSLGDSQIYCAELASHISVHQFRIAMELGDEFTVRRSILCYAHSLIQRGYLRQARKLILYQYTAAKKRSFTDSKILAICCGIWAKLKYERAKIKHKKE